MTTTRHDQYIMIYSYSHPHTVHSNSLSHPQTPPLLSKPPRPTRVQHSRWHDDRSIPHSRCDRSSPRAVTRRRTARRIPTSRLVRVWRTCPNAAGPDTVSLHRCRRCRHPRGGSPRTRPATASPRPKRRMTAPPSPRASTSLRPDSTWLRNGLVLRSGRTDAKRRFIQEFGRFETQEIGSGEECGGVGG